MARDIVMNEQLKITLLKRKFQSIPYFEEFISNYKKFNQTGIKAFDAYQQYRQEHPEFQPSNTLLMEEDFWEYRAIPNFYGNLGAADEALENARKGKVSTIRSLAGDFRGISRGFDGIEENFMDVATPEMRKEYRHLFNVVNFQACNIEKTINNWWKDTSIVDEDITGPIDEQELLNYLEPGENPTL